jgi:hypothetical protein
MAVLTREKPEDQTDSGPSAADIEAKRRKEAGHRRDRLRTKRKMQLLGVLVLGIILGLSPALLTLNARVNMAQFESQKQDEFGKMNARIDEYAASCSFNGTCKTFPFTTAAEAARLYAYACFNFAHGDEEQQAVRLKNAGGPPSCGILAGTGAADVSVDSSVHLTVPDINGRPRADLGVVGLKVWMAGQPDPLNYSVLVRATASGPHVEAAGGFYTAPPTFTLTGCQQDSVSSGQEFMARIQSLEAARVNTPNIDLTDIVARGMSIGKFGPSITAIKVKDIIVCRGTDPLHKNVVVAETVSGPVPKAQMDLQYAYSLTKDGNRWVVAGWGRVAESQLGTL